MGHNLPKYRDRIVEAARAAGAAPLEGPLAFDIWVVIKPAKSLTRKDGSWRASARRHPVGSQDGDVDNYAKTVLDCLHGIVFDNDSQVVDLHVRKKWGCESTEGIYVTVRPASAGLARSESGEGVPDL